MFSFFLLSSQHFAHEGFLLRVRRAPFGREQPPASGGNAVKLFCVRNAVPIVFLVVSAIGIYYSQFTAQYLIQEMLTRLARNSFLVLSLLIPIIMARRPCKSPITSPILSLGTNTSTS